MEKYRKCPSCGGKLERTGFAWHDELEFELEMHCPNQDCEVWGITYYLEPVLGGSGLRGLRDWIEEMGGSLGDIAKALFLEQEMALMQEEVENGT